MFDDSDHRAEGPAHPHEEQTATAERREARRYPFICPAELIDMDGSTRISARTTDLSLGGCYLDTMNPFPVDTRVRLQLTKNDQHLQLRARVTSCHMGSGMGLIFEQLTPAQMDTVVSWLEASSAPAETSLSSQPAASLSDSSSKTGAHFAERLVQILERKGILTHSEAEELLRARDS